MSKIQSAQTAHIAIPPGDSKTTHLFTPIRPDRRRTPRIHVPVPLFVYGRTHADEPFYEHASTIAVNAHGGSICLQTPVQLAQCLLVINQRNECAQRCIVVYVGAHLAGGVEVAFSFTAAMLSFWGNLRNANPTSEQQGTARALSA